MLWVVDNIYARLFGRGESTNSLSKENSTGTLNATILRKDLPHIQF